MIYDMIYLEIIYIKMIILLDNLVTSPVGNENKVGLVSSILILFGSNYLLHRRPPARPLVAHSTCTQAGYSK